MFPSERVEAVVGSGARAGARNTFYLFRTWSQWETSHISPTGYRVLCAVRVFLFKFVATVVVVDVDADFAAVDDVVVVAVAAVSVVDVVVVAAVAAVEDVVVAAVAVHFDVVAVAAVDDDAHIAAVEDVVVVAVHVDVVVVAAAAFVAAVVNVVEVVCALHDQL